jgi:hypothetical protein
VVEADRSILTSLSSSASQGSFEELYSQTHVCVRIIDNLSGLVENIAAVCAAL